MLDWSTVWADYHGKIAAYVALRVNCPHLADDLAAETFAKAIAADKAGRGPKDNLSGWLYRIAHNLVVDHYRTRGRLQVADVDEVQWLALAAGDGDLADACAAADRLERAAQRLSPSQRATWAWHAQGYPLREIVQLTGSPETAVKAVHHRAIHRLRELLAGD